MKIIEALKEDKGPPKWNLFWSFGEFSRGKMAVILEKGRVGGVWRGLECLGGFIPHRYLNVKPKKMSSNGHKPSKVTHPPVRRGLKTSLS